LFLHELHALLAQRSKFAFKFEQASVGAAVGALVDLAQASALGKSQFDAHSTYVRSSCSHPAQLVQVAMAIQVSSSICVQDVTFEGFTGHLSMMHCSHSDTRVPE
jgi:hypothetical protein